MQDKNDKVIRFDSRDVSLNVAGFKLTFNVNGSLKNLIFSPSHDKFFGSKFTSALPTTAEMGLKFTQADLDSQSTWRKCLCKTKIWQLWVNDAGNFIFFNPEGGPLQKIEVDPGYKAGQYFGNFKGENGDGITPFSQGLEIVFFVNWLANFGDVILHASGVIYDGKAHVFAGQSGVGKSTLAAALSGQDKATVIGEDQVILRWLDGQFWAFGTPWHIDPTMCSPLGAPLEKVYFLEKSQNNTGIKVMTPKEGVTRLLTSAFIPYYRKEVFDRIFDRLVLVSQKYQFYSLSYLLGTDIGTMLFNH